MDVQNLTAVFGWMTVINLAIYLWAALFIIIGRDRIYRLQAWMTGVPAEDWPRYDMDYLSRYKLGIMIFNIAPWLALKIVF
ncbi:DUF6868 family protein [Amaricoccus tamworthensis]|uniref:DUF6868 family protein n=1 Tax=Amaricoccus tamworthensis TaxID=57002 RepID=UPI003C7A7718